MILARPIPRARAARTYGCAYAWRSKFRRYRNSFGNVTTAIATNTGARRYTANIATTAAGNAISRLLAVVPVTSKRTLGKSKSASEVASAATQATRNPSKTDRAV